MKFQQIIEFLETKGLSESFEIPKDLESLIEDIEENSFYLDSKFASDINKKKKK